MTITPKKRMNSKKGSGKPAPFSNIQDSKVVSETLLECIKTGDLASFREVLASYIMSTNKVQLAKKSGLGRQTLYDLIDPNHNFDPALSTVTAVIRGLAK